MHVTEKMFDDLDRRIAALEAHVEKLRQARQPGGPLAPLLPDGTPHAAAVIADRYLEGRS